MTIGYDDANRRTSLTLPNGIVVESGYDDDSRVTGLTYKQGGSPIGTLTYAYDANGRRTNVGGTYARTALPAALTSAIYDNANQIATWAGTSFTYDNNGNLTSDGTRNYTWNSRNELVSLTGPMNGSFAYDAFGRRRSKTISGTTTQFLYDGPTTVQELAGGTPTANLLTGLGIDEYFTRTDSAGVRNYLTDALGSSVALADASGTLQTQYTYEPFGGTTTSGASTFNTFGFTGRETDGTGLYFYRARYYDPAIGRFLNEDPIGFEGGLNVYAYVGNSPLLWVDPFGLARCRYSIEGHLLTCTSDDARSRVQIGPDGIFSGRDECLNRPDCADEPNRGPIPPGTYDMVPSERYGGSWWLREGWLRRQLCRLGIGRCEFFLHLGSFTLGCITVDRYNPAAVRQFDRLRQMLSQDPRNTLEVVPR